MVVIAKDSLPSKRKVASTPIPTGLFDIFASKKTYQHVANDFHLFHQHDLNVALHLFTTTLGVWGVMTLVESHLLEKATYLYLAAVLMTTPFVTGVLHSLLGMALYQVTATMVVDYLQQNTPLAYDGLQDWHVSVAAIVFGYGLQDVAHWICDEPTFMGDYLGAGKPYLLLVHSFWLLALVIDSVLIRHCFLPFLVTRNRNIVCQVESQGAVEALGKWIHANVPITPETTHVWPHQQPDTAKPTLQIESDTHILQAFRKVFPAKHYDVACVQGMNEIYVTAVGAKQSINSDAVFYTPHTDGPYWWLPGASLYRVLVGVTPNQMVRTRFNLQHESQDQILDENGVVGFDYNRELHWIDHVPNTTNKERRSLVKLHYIVYPKGWHTYGKLCAYLNQSYNTWARGNFLRTLRPAGIYEYVMAWWIWLTTWFNALWEEYVGWSNLVYVLVSYALGPTPFLILTSFRHYCVYMATFAYREPMVAHGYLMRDSKLYKTIAVMHLASRLLPMVELAKDWPVLVLAAMGFGTTILATVRLGMVRTYFGSELGFVKPKWIEGFPYGVIPHPMIVGQLFAYGSILYWLQGRISWENQLLVGAHMAFYTTHMVQEMLTSSY